MSESKDNLTDDPGMGTILIDGAAVSTKGKAQRIAIAEVWCDPTLQPRDRESVEKEIPVKVRSFQVNGYLADQPILVEEREQPGGPGKYCVLRGHTRTAAAVFMLANLPDDYTRTFPDGKIPAVITKTLTESQRHLAAIDQSQDLERRPLTKWEQFVAIRNLVKQGYASQAGIAAKLGIYKLDKATEKQVPNREWVQIRVNLARLPSQCHSEYEVLEKKGEKSTAFRVPMIGKLYKVYKENGYDPKNANFLDAWHKCLNPVKADKDDSDTDNGKTSDRPFAVIAASDLDSLVGSIGSDEVRSIVRAIAGREPRTAFEASVNAITECQNVLRGIRLSVGENAYADIVRDAHAALAAEMASESEVPSNGELVEA